MVWGFFIDKSWWHWLPNQPTMKSKQVIGAMVCLDHCGKHFRSKGSKAWTAGYSPTKWDSTHSNNVATKRNPARKPPNWECIIKTYHKYTKKNYLPLNWLAKRFQPINNILPHDVFSGQIIQKCQICLVLFSCVWGTSPEIAPGQIKLQYFLNL